jgi:hypothetical protein
MVGGPEETSESGKGYRGGSPQTIPPGDPRPRWARANALLFGNCSDGFLSDSLKELLFYLGPWNSRRSAKRHQSKHTASPRKRA